MRLADLNLDKESKEKLRDILDEAGAFHTIGHNNPNGADYYSCPCCFESIDIKGNASTTGFLGDIEHSEDCALNILWRDLHS